MFFSLIVSAFSFGSTLLQSLFHISTSNEFVNKIPTTAPHIDGKRASGSKEFTWTFENRMWSGICSDRCSIFMSFFYLFVKSRFAWRGNNSTCMSEMFLTQFYIILSELIKNWIFSQFSFLFSQLSKSWQNLQFPSTLMMWIPQLSNLPKIFVLLIRLLVSFFFFYWFVNSFCSISFFRLPDGFLSSFRLQFLMELWSDSGKGILLSRCGS